MKRSELLKLSRILGLLASEHAGERASAALAATTFVTRHGTTWMELLTEPVTPSARKVVKVVRSHEPGIDYAAAAESRIRQLRTENTRLSRELKRAKAKLDVVAEQERRARYEA